MQQAGATAQNGIAVGREEHPDAARTGTEQLAVEQPGTAETVLLFDLASAEKQLIRRLLSSFQVQPVVQSITTIRSYILKNQDKRIVLVVFRIPADHPKPDRLLRLLRDFVGSQVPVLVLIPQAKLGELRKLLSAGADDFMELPIHEQRFSVAFLVLLEMGQALARQIVARRKSGRTIRTAKDPNRSALLTRLLGQLQEGVGYFNPKSLLGRPASQAISDRWQPLRRLGLGGFGVVWLVKEIGGNRLAVAKEPHSVQMNIRVLRSAAILKRLVHHPNIVELYEVVKDSGRLILIQEYAEGPTLQQLIEQGISASDREHYLQQLFSVIAYAHRHQILHRDIKPENIIITRDRRLKLLDFGIARDLSWQPPGTGRSEGTVNYMPPEQFEGNSCLASDIWALGVIFYIFATNAVPYIQHNGGFPQDLESVVASRAPSVINPAIDSRLDRIIMRCLCLDPQDRFANAGELLAAVRGDFPMFGDGSVLPP